MNEVNKFLEKFHKTSKDVDAVFTDGVCYWFAYILYRRFIRTGAVLMYAIADNHFGTRINDRVYDITGDVTDKYVWEPWIEFKDELKKEQIIREYIMF